MAVKGVSVLSSVLLQRTVEGKTRVGQRRCHGVPRACGLPFAFLLVPLPNLSHFLLFYLVSQRWHHTASFRFLSWSKTIPPARVGWMQWTIVQGRRRRRSPLFFPLVSRETWKACPIALRRTVAAKRVQVSPLPAVALHTEEGIATPHHVPCMVCR